VELHLLLKPFIPDMIPSVADVDPMLKVVSLPSDKMQLFYNHLSISTLPTVLYLCVRSILATLLGRPKEVLWVFAAMLFVFYRTACNADAL